MLVKDLGLMRNHHYMLLNAQLYFEVFELHMRITSVTPHLNAIDDM